MTNGRLENRPLPSVSFLIPVHNCVELTRRCLASLEASLQSGLRYEIIVVDDCSTDGTREYLESLDHGRYKVLYNKRKGNYAANNNRAAAVAKGEVLVLLNNDIYFRPGWLEPMLELLKAHPDVGGVGNIHIHPEDGLLDHAGVAFDLSGKPFQARKGRKTAPPFLFTERSAASTACFAITRRRFLGVGGFDEGYINGSEDIDLCIRLRLNGYRILIANLSQIYHLISSTEGRFDHEEANQLRLLRKWQHTTEGWGRDEWAHAYLQRYGNQPWRMRPLLAARAVLKVSQDMLRNAFTRNSRNSRSYAEVE
ncbi:MAG: glycosyltransferase family 2 protein [Verrucomicrobiota bacterium]